MRDSIQEKARTEKDTITWRGERGSNQPKIGLIMFIFTYLYHQFLGLASWETCTSQEIQNGVQRIKYTMQIQQNKNY